MSCHPQNAQQVLPLHKRGKIGWISLLVIAGFSVLVTAAVYRYAWVSEDSFITLRYVSNTVSGHGAVFNPGERVQGYTHPLWFVLLLGGCLVVRDPIYVAIGYGLFFTFVTVAFLGYTLFRLAAKPLHALGLLALLSVLCTLSEPWLSFQTSGLENSLSYLLITAIIVECYRHGTSRPGWLVLLICLLCLNRLDFAFLVAPMGVLLLVQIRNLRKLGPVFLAAMPALMWLLFAWRYYGGVLPNTAVAKMDIYLTWVDAIKQGLAYVADWFTYDTLAAGSTVLLLGLTIAWRPSRTSLACVCGVALYCLWIIWVGGDFMRGRLFLPAFTASLVSGLTAKAAQVRAEGRSLSWKSALVAVAWLTLLAVQQAIPDPGAEISKHGIVDEWEYYPGYHLDSYRQNGRLVNPYLDLGFADRLRAYAERCGQVTIHDRNPGTLGYLAGPKVSVIDTLGLTDAFIAHLPKKHLVEQHPRPGHPDKVIPISYLVSRRDVSILPGWRAAVRRGDCSLSEQVGQYQPFSQWLWPQ
jgi:arabinofuranosyltransferase